MSKILGNTPQKKWERELKGKARIGKQTRGQQTLTSGAVCSHRLSEFEITEE